MLVKVLAPVVPPLLNPPYFSNALKFFFFKIAQHPVSISGIFRTRTSSTICKKMIQKLGRDGTIGARNLTGIDLVSWIFEISANQKA
jgi:hypothetical protein